MNQLNDLEQPLHSILNRQVKIDSTQPVGGGSISNAVAVYTNEGNYFLKSNDDYNALEMFKAELDGLTTLRNKSSFNIPKAYGVIKTNGTSYLLMDLIQPTARKGNYWDKLADNLAELHRVSEESFGYHQANFIGSLPQSNQLKTDWQEFFITERMNPQMKLARDNQLVDQSFVTKFDAAILKIVKEMPNEAPALIHGDLWSGNLMVDNNGDATIIDPAVHYGHREMDIAFSQMFGGFSNEFYQAYHEVFPMEPGFSARVGLYNLYPYLVHLNLFGRSYFGHIDQTIRQFT